MENLDFECPHNGIEYADTKTIMDRKKISELQQEVKELIVQD